MFYAFHNRYGVGVVHADDGKRIGYVEVFDHKADRDDYVLGDHKAEAISAREAKPLMLDWLSACPYCDAWEVEDLRAEGLRAIAERCRRAKAEDDRTFGFMR